MDGRFAQNPATVSLSEPVNDSGTVTFGDRLPARSAGYGGIDGLSALLHWDRLDQARRAWESKPPSIKARSLKMTAEVQAVFY